MQVAIFADGGFVLRHFKDFLRKEEDSIELADEIYTWMRVEILRAIENHIQEKISLFRIYYYDCAPFAGEIVNPFNGYTREPAGGSRRRFLNYLSRKDKLTLREGRLVVNGWKVKDIEGLIKRSRDFKGRKSQARKFPVTPFDFQPNFVQKGVDTRITLDAAKLLGKGVGIFVFLTADEDFVPIMRLAQDEGIRVYLFPLGRSLSQELLMATDSICKSDYDSKRSKSATLNLR